MPIVLIIGHLSEIYFVMEEDAVETGDELVSVIITAFNEERFIGQAIESFLCQSYKHIEIIVVNDGSTDKTAQILNEYSLSCNNVKVIHFPVNRGKVVAQNSAFKQSVGKYIAIMGGDDYAAYSRIKTQVDYLIENKVSIVYSNSYMVDENNFCLIDRPVFFTSIPNPITLERVINGGGFPGGSILFTRDMAEKIYPFPSNLPYEDLWFNFIAVIHGQIGYLHEPLNYYRQHSGNSYGLYQQRSFSDFKKRYLFIRQRLVPYLEEMKRYLLNQGLWDMKTQGLYERSRDTLKVELETNVFTRLKLCIILFRKYGFSLSCKQIITYIFIDIVMILRFTTNSIRR